MHLRTLAALALLPLTCPTTVRAQTINLQPVADTYLRSSTPTNNAGSSSTILVGVSQSGSVVNHGLFRFSLADIPADAIITEATLRLISIGGLQRAANHDLYRLLVNWNELEATWNTRISPSTTWAVGGGMVATDYVSTPSSTAPVSRAPATNSFSFCGMLTELQLWLANPATNFGWILIATGEKAGSGAQLGSRENPGKEPVLTIKYTLPALPTPLTIFCLAPTGNGIRFSFVAESNRTYAVEFQDSLVATNWSVLTNIPALPAKTVLHITNGVAPSERYFRVRTP